MNTVTQTRIWEALQRYNENENFGQLCETLEDLIYPSDREIMEVAMEIETAELEAKGAEYE